MIETTNRNTFCTKTLAAPKTVTASGSTTATRVRLPPHLFSVSFVLDVSAAATLVTDTLDVVVWSKIDGANDIDIAYFTQIKGNGGAKRYFMKVAANQPQVEFEHSVALTAGQLRNYIGDEWFIAWTEAGTGSFDFTVTAIPG